MRNSDERNFFICDLPPVFANDDASIVMEYLDGYVVVAQDGKTTQREIEAAIDLLGHERLAGVILNKYRGGMVSEGYGIEDRYAANIIPNRKTKRPKASSSTFWLAGGAKPGWYSIFAEPRRLFTRSSMIFSTWSRRRALSATPLA